MIGASSLWIPKTESIRSFLGSLVEKRQPSIYSSFQMKPHGAIKNDKVEQFADVVAGTYTELINRFKSGYNDPDRIFLETVLTSAEFKTYLTTNDFNAELAKQHTRMIWKNITILDAEDPLASCRQENSLAFQMKLKHHFFLSLKTDKRMQETPLNEILEIANYMGEGDQAIIQFGFQEAEGGWEREAEKERKEFEKQKPKWWGTRREFSPATLMKPSGYGYDFVLRVLITSPEERRKRRIARGILLSLKQLNQDNELVEKPIKHKKLPKFIEDMKRRKIAVPILRNRDLMTGEEISHFMKQPQKKLQDAYPIIDSVKKPETALPAELFLVGPGIDIGDVTEKGTTKRARIPLAAYSKVKWKDILDAYCTPEFVFGEMGCGKTGEGIHRAVSAIKLGQTVFFFDTADGQATKDIHDALPADYPEEKIIHLDLTNKAYPIALGWGTNQQRIEIKEDLAVVWKSPNEITVRFDVDDFELELEKARETSKTYLKQFVCGMAQSEFTDRMDQYLSSAARAAGAQPLGIELALTSPAYREELVQKKHVISQLDIVTDFFALQDKAQRGSDDISVDGIISRLRKLSSDKFRANLFQQDPLFNEDGRPQLDFRKFADNPEGGYGYCVTIYCDKSSFGTDGQEAIMTFMLAKVLLEGAYSRVDIDQSLRKPFVIELDEPHRFIKGEMATKLGEDAAVELRKYRAKLTMFGHSPKQLGKLWDAFAAGGVQVTMYKSKDPRQFKDMADILHPLDPEECYQSLAEKWEAVVTRKLPNGTHAAFICKMCPPPSRVKDRTKRRLGCAKQFGRPWKTVQATITNKKLEYQQKDAEWLLKQLAAEEMRKEAEREAKRGARKRSKDDQTA